MSGANTFIPHTEFAGISKERDIKLCEVALRMKPEWAKTLGLGFLMNEMN